MFRSSVRPCQLLHDRLEISAWIVPRRRSSAWKMSLSFSCATKHRSHRDLHSERWIQSPERWPWHHGAASLTFYKGTSECLLDCQTGKGMRANIGLNAFQNVSKINLCGPWSSPQVVQSQFIVEERNQVTQRTWKRERGWQKSKLTILQYQRSVSI